MKIALVNHVHPDAAHVSALRMREFARGLAAAGDSVLLLTETLRPGDPGDDAAGLGHRIGNSDSAGVTHVAVRPAATPVRRAAREGRLLTPLRQAVIGAAYLARSGIFGDWRSGAAAVLKPVADAFAPDVVYGTFGNTDSWSVARDLANLAGCPWVADYKDPWDRFVPVGLRGIVAARFSDMAGMTAFSETHARHARKWFSGETQVVYSGYRDPAAAGSDLPPPPETGPLRICLSGSLYRQDYLDMLMNGLRRAADGRELVLVYAGNDGEMLRRAAPAAGGAFAVEDRGYLDAAALLDLQRASAANAYIRNEKALFQQKPIELLAAGRPVLAFPDEGAEAAGIAEEVGGILMSCGTQAEIAAAVSEIGNPESRPVDGNRGGAQRMDRYSWRVQTGILRDVLGRAAGLSP